jgi:hypothetical protein
MYCDSTDFDPLRQGIGEVCVNDVAPSRSRMRVPIFAPRFWGAVDAANSLVVCVSPGAKVKQLGPFHRRTCRDDRISPGNRTCLSWVWSFRRG